MVVPATCWKMISKSLTIRPVTGWSTTLKRYKLHPKESLRIFSGFREVSVLAPGVTQDRDIIQRWTAFGVLIVIAEWLLGFPAVRQRLTSNEYLAITSVSLSIGTASAVLIEHAGRFAACRIWARNVAMAALFRMCGRNRPAPVSNFSSQRDDV